MVTIRSNGEIKIGTQVMAPYPKADRSPVTEKHEIDQAFSKTIHGIPGFSSNDTVFVRAALDGFYKDALAGLQSLEAATKKAAAVENIYLPEERQKRQLAPILPALHALLKGMYGHIQAIKGRETLTQALIAEATRYEPKPGAEVVEELRAQEIRDEFRGMSGENQAAILRKKVVEQGNVFFLHAIEQAPVEFIRPDIMQRTEAEYIRTRTPWLLDKLNDDRHLMEAIKIKAQLIQGFAFKLLKNAGISFPDASPWNDGRFFVEGQNGFVLRLPLIPETWKGNRNTTYMPRSTREAAQFAEVMAV